VQGNVRPELRWKRTNASRVMRRYGGLTREVLLDDGPRPDLVIWPENAIQTSPVGSTYGRVLQKMTREGIALLVDSTFASPVNLRPLELGADVVIQMDCDFSHPPANIQDMLREIETHDVVLPQA
jgi:hypothetical protein